MSKLIYPSFYEALEAKGVTVDVFKVDEVTWKVRVYAPTYVNKDYILPASWGTSYSVREVLAEVQEILAKRYNIHHTSGYTTG